jgi:hypothetical protein
MVRMGLKPIKGMQRMRMRKRMKITNEDEDERG